MKNIVLKTLILSIVLISFLSFDVLADPLTEYNGHLVIQGINSYGYRYYDSESNSFNRDLGENEISIWNGFLEELQNRINSSKIIKSVQNYGNYKVLKINFEIVFNETGLYILKDDKCIGYIINSPVDSTKFYNVPEVIQIKSLPINSNYITRELDLGVYVKDIIVHENISDEFIERYVLVKYEFNNQREREYIVMYSYYPKELDSILKEDFDNNLFDNIRILSFTGFPDTH